MLNATAAYSANSARGLSPYIVSLVNANRVHRICSQLGDQLVAASHRPPVALLIDTATEWGRQVIHGIADYAHQQGGWDIWLERRCQQAPGRLPPGWHGDGIIARVADREMGRYLAKIPAPVVNVSAARIPGVHFPTVSMDVRAVARLATGHLLDQGFQHFGYYAPHGFSYAKTHYESFVESLAEVGLDCCLFLRRRGTASAVTWQRRQKELQQWLRELPKPIAILAWTSDLAREVSYACQAIGLLVPEQVAVMAGGEDSVLCETCNPPLSAVAINSERVGYEAAALLDRLLQDKPSPSEPILIEPSHVVVRQSTDTVAVDDSDLAQAITFIRANAGKRIRVNDVLRAVPVSRSWLERRFQDLLGRSPAQEIRRVRLEHTKRLLAKTDMPVTQVAAASGFGSAEYFAYAFKLATGSTPREFRKRTRGE